MATTAAPAAPATTGGGGGSAAPAAEDATKPFNPNLPPYPEMILAAIKALDDKNGSNKSAIANYIESTYGEGELPPSHASLLTAHLARMKESGELLLMKNNYFIPGPDAPRKRGRGRPPKPKQAAPPPGPVLSSPRPRGRPPKTKEPLAVAVAKASSGLPRGRGRPPKKARRPTVAASTGTSVAISAPTVPLAGVSSSPAGTAVAGIKRGRGRPPKAKPPLTSEGV